MQTRVQSGSYRRSASIADFIAHRAAKSLSSPALMQLQQQLDTSNRVMQLMKLSQQLQELQDWEEPAPLQQENVIQRVTDTSTPWHEMPYQPSHTAGEGVIQLKSTKEHLESSDVVWYQMEHEMDQVDQVYGSYEEYLYHLSEAGSDEDKERARTAAEGIEHWTNTTAAPFAGKILEIKEVIDQTTPGVFARLGLEEGVEPDIIVHHGPMQEHQELKLTGSRTTGGVMGRVYEAMQQLISLQNASVGRYTALVQAANFQEDVEAIRNRVTNYARNKAALFTTNTTPGAKLCVIIRRDHATLIAQVEIDLPVAVQQDAAAAAAGGGVDDEDM